MPSDLKIFHVDEDVWFIGATLAECQSAYRIDYQDDEPAEDPHELSDSELDTLKFVDTDENETPSGVVRTFREQLAIELAAGGKFPRLFATNNY